MSIMAPDKNEMEKYTESVGVKVDHNYLIVYKRMNLGGRILLELTTRTTSAIKGFIEKPYRLVVSKSEIILSPLSKPSEIRRLPRGNIEEFSISDESDSLKNIDFTYKGKAYHFYALKKSSYRVRYVADNLAYLDSNNWLR